MTASTAQYYHADGLGSVVAATDNTGVTVGTQRFDAWGNQIAATGTIELPSVFRLPTQRHYAANFGSC